MGVSAYKYSTDTLNHHPAVAQIAKVVADAKLAGAEDKEFSLGYTVSGKVYSDKARLSYNVHTANGVAKVACIVHMEKKADMLRDTPWKLRGDEPDEVWVPDSLTVDFIVAGQRYVLNNRTAEFEHKVMPPEAIEFSDFFAVGATQMYGPLLERLNRLSRNEIILAVGLAVFPVMIFRQYNKSRSPPLFRLVTAQLAEHPLLVNKLGAPVVPATTFAGKIGTRSARFSMEVKGSKASGTLAVQAMDIDGGGWNITSARLKQGASKGTKIDLKTSSTD